MTPSSCRRRRTWRRSAPNSAASGRTWRWRGSCATSSTRGGSACSARFCTSFGRRGSSFGIWQVRRGPVVVSRRLCIPWKSTRGVIYMGGRVWWQIGKFVLRWAKSGAVISRKSKKV